MVKFGIWEGGLRTVISRAALAMAVSCCICFMIAALGSEEKSMLWLIEPIVVDDGISQTRDLASWLVDRQLEKGVMGIESICCHGIFSTMFDI